MSMEEIIEKVDRGCVAASYGERASLIAQALRSAGYSECAASVNAALSEARAQGAAEERERLANLADAYGLTDLYDVAANGCRRILRGDWRWFATWLRSQTGEE